MTAKSDKDSLLNAANVAATSSSSSAASAAAAAASVALLNKDVEYVKGDVLELKNDIKFIKDEFLTRREFMDAFIPVRNGFFGMIGLVATGFLGAVINFFIRK